MPLSGCNALQPQTQIQHDVDENTSAKKPRVVWSVEMHQQFVNAVNLLGIDSKSISAKTAVLCMLPFLYKQLSEAPAGLIESARSAVPHPF